MLKPVYLMWTDERYKLIRCVCFEKPDEILSPELLPHINEQHKFWIARMGNPIFNFGLTGKKNMKILSRDLGYWPTPIGVEFEYLKDVDFDSDLPLDF